MKRYILILITLTMFGCSKNRENKIFENATFAVYMDSIVQSAYSAKVISRTEMESNYQSTGNSKNSNSLEFKFAINGADNEMPIGVNHVINVPVDQELAEIPVATFGKQLIQKGTEGFLKPNTNIKFRVDMNEVLKSFKENGFYKWASGDKITQQDFKGVWIAGNLEPLSWKFDDLSTKENLKLTDENGDGIYEITVTLYPSNQENFKPEIWKLTNNIAQYPSYQSNIPIVDALYNLSLDELVKNTIPDGLFETGAKWKGVWTRDISYSIILALAIINPEISKACLMKKVKNKRIIQDTGTGGSWPVSSDRMVWAVAAYEIYRVTGDKSWLEQSFEIIKNSAEDDLKTVYNPQTNLFKGESSFLDWREQSYPLWMQPIDIYNSENLATNAIHFKVYDILSTMAEELKISNTYKQTADKIIEGMNTYLWIESKGYYGQYLYGKNYLSLSPRPETLGEALCVLYDIASPEKQKKIIKSVPVLDYGIPCFWPQIPNMQSYHNNSIWPFVQAFWNLAGAKTGNEKVVNHGIAAIYRQAALFLSNKENLRADNGDENGTAINSDRQLWSVAGNLSIVYRIFYGMQFEPDKLKFSPFVPSSWRGLKTLKNFRYRNANLTITLKGFGNEIEYFNLDGKNLDQPEIPANLTGEHDIEIKLKKNPINDEVPNFTENKFAPSSPTLTLSGETLSWNRIENAEKYQIITNGKLLKETKDISIKPDDLPPYSEIQVKAIDANGLESFLSDPVFIFQQKPLEILLNKFAEKSAFAVKEYKGKGFIEISKTLNNSISISVEIAEEGDYFVDLSYANGNGPINTNNKCAIRSLYVNDNFLSSVVFPQRGVDSWNDWGFTNAVKIHLKKGQQIFNLKYESCNENMNGEINQALIQYLRIIRL